MSGSGDQKAKCKKVRLRYKYQTGNLRSQSDYKKRTKNLLKGAEVAREREHEF